MYTSQVCIYMRGKMISHNCTLKLLAKKASPIFCAAFLKDDTLGPFHVQLFTGVSRTCVALVQRSNIAFSLFATFQFNK